MRIGPGDHANLDHGFSNVNKAIFGGSRGSSEVGPSEVDLFGHVDQLRGKKVPTKWVIFEL